MVGSMLVTFWYSSESCSHNIAKLCVNVWLLDPRMLGLWFSMGCSPWFVCCQYPGCGYFFGLDVGLVVFSWFAC